MILAARIIRIRTSGGGSAWMIEGTNQTIAEAIGADNQDVDELDVELTLGAPPAKEVAPIEAHSIARTGLTTT